MPPSKDEDEVKGRLFKAIESGDRGAVEELLEEHLGLMEARNAEGLSPLLWAAYFERADLCDLLLKKGAKPDIFEASALGLRDRVKALLQTDRSLVEAYSPDGWTPLHLAAHFGRSQVMRTLLSRGASHRAVARNGIANQPLQAAAAGGQREAVRLLLRAGADPNAPSHGGITALHTAAGRGDRAMVETLLEAGADPGRGTDGGKTALDYAREKAHQAVVDLLEAALGAS